MCGADVLDTVIGLKWLQDSSRSRCRWAAQYRCGFHRYCRPSSSTPAKITTGFGKMRWFKYYYARIHHTLWTIIMEQIDCFVAFGTTLHASELVKVISKPLHMQNNRPLILTLCWTVYLLLQGLLLIGHLHALLASSPSWAYCHPGKQHVQNLGHRRILSGQWNSDRVMLCFRMQHLLSTLIEMSLNQHAAHALVADPQVYVPVRCPHSRHPGAFWHIRSADVHYKLSQSCVFEGSKESQPYKGNYKKNVDWPVSNIFIEILQLTRFTDPCVSGGDVAWSN